MIYPLGLLEEFANTINGFMLYNFWITSSIIIFYSIICIRITEIIRKSAFDKGYKIIGGICIIFEMMVSGFLIVYITIALILLSICSLFTNTPIERCIGVFSNQIV